MCVCVSIAFCPSNPAQWIGIMHSRGTSIWGTQKCVLVLLWVGKMLNCIIIAIISRLYTNSLTAAAPPEPHRAEGLKMQPVCFDERSRHATQTHPVRSDSILWANIRWGNCHPPPSKNNLNTRKHLCCRHMLILRVNRSGEHPLESQCFQRKWVTNHQSWPAIVFKHWFRVKWGQVQRKIPSVTYGVFVEKKNMHQHIRGAAEVWWWCCPKSKLSSGVMKLSDSAFL